jgi:hypothetical protein
MRGLTTESFKITERKSVPSEGYRCILIHCSNITRTGIGEEEAEAAKGKKERKMG